MTLLVSYPSIQFAREDQMKRICNTVILALIVGVMLIANFAPVSAKKGKTGPGYTSPPLCCTEPQCQHGPGWKTSPSVRLPALVGPRAAAKAVHPGARK